MSNNHQQQSSSWQQYYGYSQYQQQPQPYYEAPGYNQQQYQHTASLCPPPPGFQQTAPPPPKRPRPTFRCDTCDLDLDSAMALDAHVKSHITCTECNKYTACPKMVKAHYQAVHGKFSGNGFKTVTVAVPGCPMQRFRICVGNSKEDVAKWIADRKKKFPRKAPPPTKLGSLLDGYGSSSSDEDKPKMTDATKQEVVTKPVTNRPVRICRFFARTGKCRNGDACAFRHERGTSNQQRNNNNRKRKDVSSATLLRKLLRPDADREATLTLQLLRYIANCNYLQEQKKDGSEK